MSSGFEFKIRWWNLDRCSEEHRSFHLQKFPTLSQLSKYQPEILRMNDDMTASTSSQADWSLKPDSALVVLDDGGGRLLDLNGNFYGLSATATYILEQTLKHGTNQATHNLTAQYGLDRRQAEKELQTFLAGLNHQGLIFRGEATQSIAATKPSLFFISVLWLVHGCVPGLRLRCQLLLTCAYFAVRTLSWPRTLATWRRFHEQRSGSLRSKASPALISAVVQGMTAGHLLPIECKERSLTCWSLFKECGEPVRLVVGVDFYPFASHCWCEVDGNVVADFSDRCANYRPVFVYE